MNDLEKALLDSSDNALDFYLEVESTANIRKHIEEIKAKAAGSTDAGRIKLALQRLVDSI